VMVVDDYAHHPEEVRATLRAAREGVARDGDRRLVTLFQPHRYTRTRDLFDDFLSAFDDADVLVLTEIYTAGEEHIDGVSGEALYRALKKRGHVDVHFVPQKEELATAVMELVQAGDVVLTLGAGDIHRAGVELLFRLREGGTGAR
jgi:UDP-N-acetylmuramate--alanine ligase